MRKSIISIATIFFAFPAITDPIQVVAFGDSLTQGYGLQVKDGFVPQLRAWADAQGLEVALSNAGVSGDTTAGGLSRVAWTLTPDVEAMIVTLGGNDVLRGIDPAVSRANLHGILSEAKAADVTVLLIGMKAPGNFGPDYKAEFDSMYPELAEEFNAVFLDSFFAGLGDAINDPVALGPYMQGDAIHPNADGVALIVQGVGPKLVELLERVAG
ncbi:MAG: arylesterase [Ascidiaceihabitans sp.]|jgi:acyl-CoA thioesterase-1|nr:arylesterase [Ascidiaceihabitans sp.]